MSARLHAVNLWLRFAVKPILATMRDPDHLRRRFERDAARFFPVPPGAHFSSTRIRRPDGTAMEALSTSIGRPDRRKVILYLHGGAYLAGSAATHRHLAAALAGHAGVRALVPDYRLAPENPFPAAPEDAVTAFVHLLDAGYAADEIALVGDSAGGGLCFGLLQALEAEGLPQPAAVVGFSPWTDLTGNAESLRRNAARDVLLPARRVAEVTDLYLAGGDARDPRASPGIAEWHDPPPALILAGRGEILLDDARRLAEGLRSAGGSVQLELWRGVPHAWPILCGRLPEADRAVVRAGEFLARQLGTMVTDEAA